MSSRSKCPSAEDVERTAAASGSSRGEKRRRIAATGPLKKVSAPMEAVILPPESVEALVPLYPSAKLLGKCKPLAEDSAQKCVGGGLISDSVPTASAVK